MQWRRSALETGGRAIIQKNDIDAALGQVIQRLACVYLIAYESPHPDDGKFHGVGVRVKRKGTAVFARTGYWAFKRNENTAAASPAVAAVPPAVQAAFEKMAGWLRPDADEPTEGRRRVIIPQTANTPPAPLLAAPTIGLARGRMVGNPVVRREFHRTDTLVIRTATTGTPAVVGRLLDRRGQPLTDLPMTSGAGGSELRLALGSLGSGGSSSSSPLARARRWFSSTSPSAYCASRRRGLQSGRGAPRGPKGLRQTQDAPRVPDQHGPGSRPSASSGRRSGRRVTRSPGAPTTPCSPSCVWNRCPRLGRA